MLLHTICRFPTVYTPKITVEITDYIDLIKNSSMPEGLTVYLDDYAMNSSVCYIPFPETDSRDLEFENPEIEIDINETCDLTKLLMHKDSADPVETDYLKTLKWYIKDDTGVVALKNGLVEGLKTGTAIVMVTSDSWVTPNNSTGQWVNVPSYKTLVVNVTDTMMEFDASTGQFYKGHLRSGQVLEFEQSVIVIGDVNPGASIISKGNIIILGSLRGTAFAGAAGKKNSFIVAMDMQPMQLRIADVFARASDNSKEEAAPRIAFVEDENIYIEPLTKSVLNDITL